MLIYVKRWKHSVAAPYQFREVESGLVEAGDKIATKDIMGVHWHDATALHVGKGVRDFALVVRREAAHA